MKKYRSELEECWVCEGCAAVSEGVNPPDSCEICLHTYFDSMADIVASAPKPEHRH